jgi:hypothetical protein
MLKPPEECSRLARQITDELFAFWQEERKSIGNPPITGNLLKAEDFGRCSTSSHSL